MEKKLLSFFGLCAYVVGVIGGFGFAIYGKGYFIAACIIALGVMAFPKAKEFFRILSS